MSSAPSNKRKQSSDNETQTNNHHHHHETNETEHKSKEAKKENKDETKENKEENKKYPKVMNSICHIDIPVLNVDRACAFFRDVFTWTYMPWKPDYCLFIGASTQCVSGGIVLVDEKNEKRFPWPLPSRPMLLYLLTEDVNATLNLVHKSGGIVVRPRTLIGPGIGSNAMFYDTEGNYLAVYSTNCDNIVETKSLTQTVSLKGSPHVIYEKMLDEKLHTAFAGKESKIDRQDGGEFKIYEGYITGRMICTEKDHKIVQSWRGADWPEGHFSTVTLTLTADSKTGGTTLNLKQDDVPVGNFEALSKGWHQFYWDKIDL